MKYEVRIENSGYIIGTCTVKSINKCQTNFGGRFFIFK